MADTQTKPTFIFTCGTLKKDFPNYNLIQDLIPQNDATFIGTFITCNHYPLVIGPHGIPYLVNLPDVTGAHRVKGELYSVSARGLLRLDELEGTSIGHYERLPIQVTEVELGGDKDGFTAVEAEAYYAHRSFGERMWERSGRVGLTEYTRSNAEKYVRIENRPSGFSYFDHIESFLSNP